MNELRSPERHTPGPWNLEGERIYHENGKAWGSPIFRDGLHVGTWYDAEWNGNGPNAKLIAAAPDLLAACKAVLRHPHVRSYLPYDPTDETFLGLVAAIKKAEETDA